MRKYVLTLLFIPVIIGSDNILSIQPWHFKNRDTLTDQSLKKNFMPDAWYLHLYISTSAIIERIKKALSHDKAFFDTF